MDTTRGASGGGDEDLRGSRVGGQIKGEVSGQKRKKWESGQVEGDEEASGAEGEEKAGQVRLDDMFDLIRPINRSVRSNAHALEAGGIIPSFISLEPEDELIKLK